MFDVVALALLCFALLACSPSSQPQPQTNKKTPTGKLAGLDKKLSRSLDAEVATGCSPAELSKSPVGPLSDAGERTFLFLNFDFFDFSCCWSRSETHPPLLSSSFPPSLSHTLAFASSLSLALEKKN